MPAVLIPNSEVLHICDVTPTQPSQPNPVDNLPAFSIDLISFPDFVMGSLPANGSQLKVGIALGRGTGTELSSVFNKFITHLSKSRGITVAITQLPRILHSYNSLLADYGDDASSISAAELDDVAHYEAFLEELVASGHIAVFRTAINANSLYMVRQHLESVKVECFSQGSNQLLLVRDQAQGFYVGENHFDLENETVTRPSTFRRSTFANIIAYAIQRATQLWGSVDAVTMVYKFHLFSGICSVWAEAWSKQFGVKITFVQPDTMSRNLLAHGVRGKQLLVAGNEWANIMHVWLLDRLNQVSQGSQCTENVYLSERVDGLVEYQTMHGSADDIEGKGIANPGATMRAAAKILEKHGGCKGMIEEVERAIKAAEKRSGGTPDLGGKMETTQVVDEVLKALGS